MDDKDRKAYKRIEELFKSSSAFLRRSAYAFVRDEETANDIVSEAFIALIEHRDEVEPEKYFSYLFETVKNKSINIRKADARHNAITEQIQLKERRMMEHFTNAIESSSLSEVRSGEILSIYKKKMSELSPLTREIFTLSRRDAKSRAEIASALGISENKVRYEISKALKELKGVLGDYGEFLPLVLMILSASFFNS